MMKCYYAHPITSYGTTGELQDIEQLSKAFDVVNPNDPALEAEYKVRGMAVFLELVADCDCLAIRAFNDGAIPAGVAKEAQHAMSLGKLVFELPTYLQERTLTVEETRVELKKRGRI